MESIIQHSSIKFIVLYLNRFICDGLSPLLIYFLFENRKDSLSLQKIAGSKSKKVLPHTYKYSLEERESLRIREIRSALYVCTYALVVLGWGCGGVVEY